MKTLLAAAIVFTAIPAIGCPPGSGPRPGKLQTIRIPRVELRNATVEEALEYVRRRSRELDPEGVGINIVYKKPLPASAAVPATKLAVPAQKPASLQKPAPAAPSR